MSDVTPKLPTLYEPATMLMRPPLDLECNFEIDEIPLSQQPPVSSYDFPQFNNLQTSDYILMDDVQEDIFKDFDFFDENRVHLPVEDDDIISFKM